jgi:hypothetical protein
LLAWNQFLPLKLRCSAATSSPYTNAEKKDSARQDNAPAP